MRLSIIDSMQMKNQEPPDLSGAGLVIFVVLLLLFSSCYSAKPTCGTIAAKWNDPMFGDIYVYASIVTDKGCSIIRCDYEEWDEAYEGDTICGQRITKVRNGYFSTK